MLQINRPIDECNDPEGEKSRRRREEEESSDEDDDRSIKTSKSIKSKKSWRNSFSFSKSIDRDKEGKEGKEEIDLHDEGGENEYDKEDVEGATVIIRGEKVSVKEFLTAAGENRRKEGRLVHKKSRVVVNNVNYSVKATPDTGIRTISGSFANFFSGKTIKRRRNKIEEKILNNVSFTLESGEMTLLLGGPGSGKTSLLDIIAHRRTGKLDIVSGDILLNGQKPDLKSHPNEISYVIQEDIHLPLLTVKETFQFAAKLQMPPQYNDQEIKDRIDLVTQVLQLSHCEDTYIGNDLIRGISGGEKRRVSVGVEWMKKPAVFLLDEPTTGLDAAAAFRLGRDLKVISSFGPSVLCSLLQPSYELFCKFDKIIVLSGGEIAYWGPRESALGYFENLGYYCPKTYNEAEFLSIVVDQPERFWDENSDKQIKVRSTKEFIDAWNQSAMKKSMQDLLDLDLKSPISSQNLIATTGSKQSAEGKEDVRKNPEVGKSMEPEIVMEKKPIEKSEPSKHHSSKYNYTYAKSSLQQLKLLLWRGFVLLWREKSRYALREANDLLIALIMGLVFLGLDDSILDSRNKVALLFFTLFILGFSSLAGIPGLFPLKPIFYYQVKSRYFSTEMYFIAQLILQIPFSLVESVFFGTIVYWMAGLNSDPTRWLFFLLVLFLVFLTGVVLSLLWAFLSPNEVLGSVSGTAFLSILILFSGFLIPKQYIPIGWVWFYWISYFQYAIQALITNEFSGSTLVCDPAEFITVPETGELVCPITRGEDFIGTYEGYVGLNNRWWNLAAVFGFYILFALLSYLVMKFVVRVATLRAGVKDVTEKLSKYQESKKIEKDSKYKSVLTFENITYTAGNKTILHGINGYVKPGMCLALMGPSGAGKSTLLDVLANLKKKKQIGGERKLNGEIIKKKKFHRYVGYVEQFDLLFPYHTVLEALEFSAKCRLSPKVTQEERDKIIQRSIDLLNLSDIAGKMIGYPDDGIRREQRKRLSIAIELCAMPQILFLDEPTSGLDSLGADNVMLAIENITKSGTACICTIHQPSKRIFSRCTHLLLMKKGGYQVYFGPLGEDQSTILNYFKDNLGLVPPEHKNPADFILENTNGTDEIDTSKIFEEGQLKKDLVEELKSGIQINKEEVQTFKRRYPLHFGQQIWINLKRFLIAYRRNPSQNVFIILRAIFLGVVIGTAFFNMSLDQSGATLRPNLLFFVANIADFTAFAAIIPIFLTRPLFYRERAAGMYKASAFGIAKLLSDIPGIVLELTLTFALIYLISHLQFNWGRAFFAYLVFIGLYLVPSAIGQFYATLTKNVENASLIFATSLTFATLTSGFLIERSGLGWLVWGYWVSYVQYVVQALVLNEVINLNFYCSPGEALDVNVIINGTNSILEYCQYQTGRDIIDQYDMIPGLKWGAVGAIYGLYIFFAILVLFGFTFINHQKR